jgi:hypothetical protein
MLCIVSRTLRSCSSSNALKQCHGNAAAAAAAAACHPSQSRLTVSALLTQQQRLSLHPCQPNMMNTTSASNATFMNHKCFFMSTPPNRQSYLYPPRPQLVPERKETANLPLILAENQASWMATSHPDCIVRQVDVAQLAANYHGCEDAAVACPERGLYAVFDGRYCILFVFLNKH